MALLYASIVIFQAPGLMLLIGALSKLVRMNSRLHRVQFEGAVMMVAAMLASWIIFDVHFGVDPYRLETWSEWFERGETGLFYIGLLFVLLGFFLERRPRPGLRPWPFAGKLLAGVSILLGIVLSRVAAAYLGLAFLDLPFSMPRMLFLFGLFPFCLGYMATGLRHVDPRPINLDQEEE